MPPCWAEKHRRARVDRSVHCWHVDSFRTLNPQRDICVYTSVCDKGFIWTPFLLASSNDSLLWKASGGLIDWSEKQRKKRAAPRNMRTPCWVFGEYLENLLEPGRFKCLSWELGVFGGSYKTLDMFFSILHRGSRLQQKEMAFEVHYKCYSIM